MPKLQKWKFAHRTLEGIFLLLQRLTLYSHSTSSESLHTGEMEISSYLPDLSNIYHDKFVKDKILERAVHGKNMVKKTIHHFDTVLFPLINVLDNNYIHC